jgi:hypothetical protein
MLGAGQQLGAGRDKSADGVIGNVVRVIYDPLHDGFSSALLASWKLIHPEYLTINTPLHKHGASGRCGGRHVWSTCDESSHRLR